MSKFNISKEEQEIVSTRESFIGSIVEIIDGVRKFKVGDYLIAFSSRESYGGRKPILNSFGAPKKFIVVAADNHGVPYMKELNKSGKPVGQLISPLRFVDQKYLVKSREFEFEVDPEYIDSTIMMDEDNYDPTLAQRVKSDLFKEITSHNKSVKIKVSDEAILIPFLNNLKVGDVLWKSMKTNITITDIKPLVYFNKKLDRGAFIGKAVDSNGKEHTLSVSFFKYGGAFYTDRPRSYNELKDPK